MLPSALIYIPFRIIRITVVLFFLIAPKNIYTWDLAVASDEGLNLLTLDGSLEFGPISSAGNESLVEMFALAFDPSHSRFFYSVHDSNGSILVFDLEHNTSTPLLSRGQYNVQGLAFDTSTQTLYWTDGNGHTIRKMEMKNSREPLVPETVIRLEDQIPAGIAISYCHRGLFWANSNHTSASLNRAELDGTNHAVIVSKDVFLPLAVTVDEAYGKVYWSDDRPGIYYRIERCALDGSDRELVLQRTHQEPFGLALIGVTLLWSDTVGKRVWSLSTDMTFPNHTKAQLEPGLLYQYTREKPMGVAANRNVTISCEPIKVLRIPDEPEDTEELPFPDNALESTRFCLNGGELVQSQCRCKPGFDGKRCEIPNCHQHCLHGGTCYHDRHGYPNCKCLLGFEGRRCERDVCDDFCLAGGRCYVEAGQPTCQCPAPTLGQRCEVTASLTALPSSQELPIVAGLAAVGCALLVVVAILSWRVIVLRRRPRVKKRYIVNKAYRAQNGQTPMTSRPPSSPAVEQCEITIENCCNMNICETPCFEPNIRSSKSSSKKTEDRRNLLGNMEEPGGSD